MSFREQINGWTKRFVFLPIVGVLLAAIVLLWFALAPLSNLLVRAAIVLVVAALSGVAAWWWRGAAMRVGEEMISSIGRVIVAGDWVLRMGMGKSPIANVDADADLLTEGEQGGVPGIVGPLEEWLQSAGSSGEGEGQMSAAPSDSQRDMELAKEFQQAFLNRRYPKVPEVHVQGRLRLEFYHRYEPAMALGGDFFNIMTVAPDCAGVFIADVMGHGTRSALITSMLRTLIGELEHQSRNAPHFLTELNRQFCAILQSLPSPLFASACYFVPDTTARVATYSSAGHPAPFMVRSYLKRVTRLEVPPPRGTALGVIPNETYSGGHVRLMPGDVFLFFTDGVYEAHNQEGEEFGVKRMEEILKKLIYRGAHEMVDGLMTAVKEFVGNAPIIDDICLVAVEVTEKAVGAADTRA